jgi:hypothetical protein
VTVAPQTFTILVNGCCTDPYTAWIQPGSDEFNAIAATYGQAPLPWEWTSNSRLEVIPPLYNGIYLGAQELANLLNSLPPGDVNIISHSHGGNVVLLSQAWSSRPIRRYIQLATPVNWDFGDWRYALAYGVAGRCQVSSTADWMQFWGASPYQVGNFIYNVYQSVAGAIEAFEALNAGDYESSYWWFASSVFDAIEADYWWETTKKEVEGPTVWFHGLGHPDLHEPPVWNTISTIDPWCR